MARLPTAIMIVLALALASCGVKSGLQAPPGSPPPSNDPIVLDPLI